MIKHPMFVFFKDSLKKRAVTPTLELDEGKFEYERSSSKTERVFLKKRTQFPISFLQSKTTFHFLALFSSFLHLKVHTFIIKICYSSSYFSSSAHTIQRVCFPEAVLHWYLLSVIDLPPKP